MKKALLFSITIAALTIAFKLYKGEALAPIKNIKESPQPSHVNNLKKEKPSKKTPVSNKAQVYSYIGDNKDTQAAKAKKTSHQKKEDLYKHDQHSAQTDNQGRIYPKSVKIDDDMIIAYGDLIVGSSRNLEDYQSGDKSLNIPPPVLWPNGSIPYEIDNSLDNPVQLNDIEKVVNSINQMAAINFHPRQSSEHSFVLFKKGAQHCYANVGYRIGVTNVSLSSNCGQTEIFHELFHVLGFYHEQNRPDRDDYIDVLWQNIDEDNWPQFERFTKESYPLAFQNLSKLPFSFDSIMLYKSTAFSESSDYSMVRIDGTPFGETNLFPSAVDEDRLKLLYPKK